MNMWMFYLKKWNGTYWAQEYDIERYSSAKSFFNDRTWHYEYELLAVEPAKDAREYQKGVKAFSARSIIDRVEHLKRNYKLAEKVNCLKKTRKPELPPEVHRVKPDVDRTDYMQAVRDMCRGEK